MTELLIQIVHAKNILSNEDSTKEKKSFNNWYKLFH